MTQRYVNIYTNREGKEVCDSVFTSWDEAVWDVIDNHRYDGHRYVCTLSNDSIVQVTDSDMNDAREQHEADEKHKAMYSRPD